MARADRPKSPSRLITGILTLAITTSTSACAHKPTDHQATTQPAPGLPAIPTHNNTTPAFSAADVRQFINTHPLPNDLLPTGHVVVTQATFMTSENASHLMAGEPTGLPPQSLVCYTTIAGGFTLHAGPPAATKATKQVPMAVLIFDAATGNLLMDHTQ